MSTAVVKQSGLGGLFAVMPGVARRKGTNGFLSRLRAKGTQVYPKTPKMTPKIPKIAPIDPFVGSNSTRALLGTP